MLCKMTFRSFLYWLFPVSSVDLLWSTKPWPLGPDTPIPPGYPPRYQPGTSATDSATMVLTCRTERMEAFGKTNNQALKVSCQWQATAAVLLPMSRWWSFSQKCGEVYLVIQGISLWIPAYRELKPIETYRGCATCRFTLWLGRHGFNEIYNFGFKHLQLERPIEEYTLSTLWLASNKASIVSRSVL